MKCASIPGKIAAQPRDEANLTRRRSAFDPSAIKKIEIDIKELTE